MLGTTERRKPSACYPERAAVHEERLLTNAKKATVSVLYWYIRLPARKSRKFFYAFSFFCLVGALQRAVTSTPRFQLARRTAFPSRGDSFGRSRNHPPGTATTTTPSPLLPRSRPRSRSVWVRRARVGGARAGRWSRAGPAVLIGRGHTAKKAPVPVRLQKLSFARPR